MQGKKEQIYIYINGTKLINFNATFITISQLAIVQRVIVR